MLVGKHSAAFAFCCASWRDSSTSRRRSRLAPTLAEREGISRGIASGSLLQQGRPITYITLGIYTTLVSFLTKLNELSLIKCLNLFL
jgi:hypothetical protein